MSDRPTYSPAQLSQYFDRINLPPHLRPSTSSFSSLTTPAQQLSLLTLLLKHHITSIPFENLSLHYSTHRTVNVQAHNVHDKIVLHRQGQRRGGYCMENNTLFHTVLLSLGFDVYLAGARVFDEGRYAGFSHCLNIVTLIASAEGGEGQGDRYIVDVGFGANEPVRPLKLEPDTVQYHTAPASARLRFAPIAQGVKRSSDNKLWIYEHRYRDEEPWAPVYCFSDIEFLPEDLAIMNLWPQKDPRSLFTWKLMCVRFTLDTETIAIPGGGAESSPEESIKRDGPGEINGALILDGANLKWRRNGDKVFEVTFSSEAERLQGLERYFGIVLSRGDSEAIRGTILSIPDK